MMTCKENAIFIEGEQDGVFDNEDYILFYAQGPDHWEINNNQFKLSKHNTNIYSDYAYYFITTDKGVGKRISTSSPIDQSCNNLINTYHRFDFHEMENVNLFANGQQWLGEDFSFQETQNFSFDFNDLDHSEAGSLSVRGVAISSSDTQMTVQVNGQELMDLNYPRIPRIHLQRLPPMKIHKQALLNNEQIRCSNHLQQCRKSIFPGLSRFYRSDW